MEQIVRIIDGYYGTLYEPSVFYTSMAIQSINYWKSILPGNISSTIFLANNGTYGTKTTGSSVTIFDVIPTLNYSINGSNLYTQSGTIAGIINPVSFLDTNGNNITLSAPLINSQGTSFGPATLQNCQVYNNQTIPFIGNNISSTRYDGNGVEVNSLVPTSPSYVNPLTGFNTNWTSTNSQITVNLTLSNGNYIYNSAGTTSIAGYQAASGSIILSANSISGTSITLSTIPNCIGYLNQSTIFSLANSIIGVYTGGNFYINWNTIKDFNSQYNVMQCSIYKTIASGVTFFLVDSNTIGTTNYAITQSLADFNTLGSTYNLIGILSTDGISVVDTSGNSVGQIKQGYFYPTKILATASNLE